MFFSLFLGHLNASELEKVRTLQNKLLNTAADIRICCVMQKRDYTKLVTPKLRGSFTAISSRIPRTYNPAALNLIDQHLQSICASIKANNV